MFNMKLHNPPSLHPTSGCPLANTQQSTTWWLETWRSLVGDDLHQTFQGVIWVLVFAASLSPGWLGRLHGPERNRDLQTNGWMEYTPVITHRWCSGSLSPSVAFQSTRPPVLWCDWWNSSLATPPQLAMAPGQKPREQPRPPCHRRILQREDMDAMSEFNEWEQTQYVHLRL